jgi:hypothetical protein
MRIPLKLFLVAALSLVIKCNLWDNIFSKIRGVPRVQVDTDFHSEFPILRNQRQFFVTLDYNLKERLATIEVDT